MDQPLGTIDISRNVLISCINQKSILDNILKQNDQMYEIVIFRKPTKLCEICSYKSPYSAIECEMCNMPLNNILFGSGPAVAPAPTVAVAPAPTVAPTVAVAPAPAVAEHLILKVKESDSDSTTYSVNTTSTSNTVVDPELLNAPTTYKLYMKGWSAENCPFINDTVDNLINHFNEAICRAKNCEYINHIEGMYQIGKSNTSALIVFTNDLVADTAIKFDNNILWKKSYLRLQRPQGYQKINNNIFSEIKLNIVREIEGVELPPIIEQKKKKTPKKPAPMKIIEKNINTVSKKKETVKIQSTKEQLELVTSLQANLRRNPLMCLTIICSHDGRETNVAFDHLSELCTVLHDHKVIVAEVNKTQIKIKNIGNITQPFCIEKRGKEHVMQHAVAEVRKQLNNANFPVWEFT